MPELQWFQGLHVIVAIDEVRRRLRTRATPFSEYNRVTGGWKDLSGQPSLFQLTRQPIRRARDVVLVLGSRTDAWYSKKLEEFSGRGREV